MRFLYTTAFFLIIINTVYCQSISCIQTSDGSGSGTTCSSQFELYCSRPHFGQYTGAAEGVPYKCGRCEQGTVDKTCYECKPSLNTLNCNAPPALGTPFKCYDYKETGGKWEKTETMCTPLKGLTVACNSPAISDTPDSSYTSTSGCGPCPDDTLSCKTCTDKELCNAAALSRTTSVTLVVMLCVQYFFLN